MLRVPNDVPRDWVENALTKAGKRRQPSLTTRHYTYYGGDAQVLEPLRNEENEEVAWTKVASNHAKAQRQKWKSTREGKHNLTKEEKVVVSFIDLQDTCDVYAEAAETREEGDPSPAVPVGAIRRCLKKMYENLGQCSKADVLRILIHGQASPLAIKECRRFSCKACDENKKPPLPRDVALPRDYSPLTKVGMDVKWLPG